MFKAHNYHILVISVLVGLCVPLASARETGAVDDPIGVDLIIDETLDQFQGGVDQVEVEEAVVEPAIADEEILEHEIDIPDDVQILEEVSIIEEANDEEILETKVIPLLHAEASGIIETLEQMKSPAGIISYNGEDRTLIIKDGPGPLEEMSAFVKKVDILLETEIFQLKHIKAQDVLAEVEALLTNNVGQVRIDEDQNSIVATDIPLIIGQITQLISRLDFINKEIQTETKILKIVLNDEHTEGVDWEAIVSDYQSVPFSGISPESDPQNGSYLNMGSVTHEDYGILLEALDTVGIVREISNNIIKGANDVTQIIRVPSSENSTGQGSLSEDSLQGAVQFLLTPMIDRDDLLTVSVLTQYKGSNAGRLSKDSEGKTTIRIKSGATIVIGSLFSEVMVESSWKIPLLGDIPILGFVFRNQGEVPRKAEMITFITIKTVEKNK